ncbi:MAG: NADPH-dependent F420 reductase [Acidimicrobiia bacterium]|nr:NADPH-dependent F420 reductase [Acidimicrobiia bacterium]
MLRLVEIGVLGATGPAGRGLAARLACLGHDVIAGSRDAARSASAVAELSERWGDRLATLVPGTNADAAAARDLVIVATTWDAAVDTTRDHAGLLEGKVVVAMANGLVRVGKEFQPVLPEEGSLAAAMQAVAPGARVVAAFQHVPAAAFAALDEPLESDVVVCGDDDAARATVLDLVYAMPNLRGLDGGSLANAVGIEAFAAVLLSINLRYKGKGTLRLLGVESGRE